MVEIAVEHDNKPSQRVVRRLNAEVINGDAEKRVWELEHEVTPRNYSS